MPFKISELREYLLTDPKVKILIVEGRGDIEIWKDVVPITDRKNCQIYSIEEIDIAVGIGGNKGAAIGLSLETIEWPEGDRIWYFLDADNDNLLGVEYGKYTTLTDHRDMEAYAMVKEAFERLCKSGASETEKEYDATRSAVASTVRRVGVLRLTSEKNCLNLPFRETLRDGTLSRFLRKKGRYHRS